MEKQEINSEFLKKVKDFVTELQEDRGNESVNRGFVILAAETPKEGEHPDTTQIIGVGGNSLEIIKCISELATQDATMYLFKEGMKMGAIKAMAKTILNK